MSELKACAHCGHEAARKELRYYGEVKKWAYCQNGDCPMHDRTMTVDAWNTRPIEDALTARIAEFSQAVGLITTLKPTMVMDANHPLDMAREVAEHVTARIAELKELLDTESQLSNQFYLLLVDNPKLKKLADDLIEALRINSKEVQE